MPDETRRHIIVVGLDVQDDALYTKYRAGLMPILKEYGGFFEYDFVVSKVLKSKGEERINRVFTISFPNRDSQTRFFEDERYLRVRSERFEPSVASMTSIAEYDAP